MSEEPAKRSNLLGLYTRAQRQMANLSLRELSSMIGCPTPISSRWTWAAEPSGAG